MITAFVYTLAIHLYGLGIRIAALWSTKAKKWRLGRQHLFSNLSSWRQTVEHRPLVWVHCASHGEYEQVLPLVRRIRERQPATAVALTFFSASGYEAVAETAPVDWVGYLPLDTKSNARQWLDTMRPSVVIFVKNEWWWHILSAMTSSGVPVHIVSATIRSDHFFLRYRSRFFRDCLRKLSTVGVVEEASKARLSAKVDADKIYVSGDLRADRVMQIASERDSSFLQRLPSSHQYVIYGSVWHHDLQSIRRIIAAFPDAVHLLFPHRLEAEYVEAMRLQLDAQYLVEGHIPRKGNILMVTEMGLLSSAYRYGTLAYVGGGYGEGIHNILEAAVYKIPVLVGPRHQKSIECLALMQLGAVANMEQLSDSELKSMDTPVHLENVKKTLTQYFNMSGEPTDITYNHIFGLSH